MQDFNGSGGAVCIDAITDLEADQIVSRPWGAGRGSQVPHYIKYIPYFFKSSHAKKKLSLFILPPPQKKSSWRHGESNPGPLLC